MKYGKGIGFLLGALLLFALVSCEDSTGSSDNSEKVTFRDSVVVRDSIRMVDSVRIVDSVQVNVVDSLNIVDSIHVVDSVRIVDSLNVIDSVINMIDSINVIDSIHVIDSLNIVDSVHVVDSIVLFDPEHYFGKCTRENSDVIKSTTINEENRHFICDSKTLLWRTATQVDWNNQYIYNSAVKEFVPIQTVAKDLAEGEKLILVLRHAERGSDYSITGPLNENGISQSLELGRILKSDLTFYYGASQYVRAHQTCNNIAKGRDEQDTLADTLSILNDDMYVKDAEAYKKAKKDAGDGWKAASKWVYENAYTDAFYDLEMRSTELIDDFLIPALIQSEKSVGLFVSHDVAMVPLVLYVSSRNIDLKYHVNKNWLNYLAGIAIVLKPDGTRVFYAVRGLDSGTMTK
ncbi:histidine phosphatase family protein [uncultured Fibrobacter sp.]|uniref:histidine phosphatase family protein n=1 Tax=uncultured Fibrobacter sp. TaxID=261512 RepID=UPI002622A435|nr:histidine phosphatase family protein [uncultured Fibrobacter sp.]